MAAQEEELRLEELEDANASFDIHNHNTETTTRTQTPLAVVDEEMIAQCRRCRWDRPEAWLVQSDSVDEEVSVAAMV